MTPIQLGASGHIAARPDARGIVAIDLKLADNDVRSVYIDPAEALAFATEVIHATRAAVVGDHGDDAAENGHSRR